ncbi:hypothetical protein MMC25_000242, partial [Agyrium rufum]|nr:hypothetical protein [Agyrium rufum]
VFGGFTTFYPGAYLNLKFEDGSESNYAWLAIYNGGGPTGPLATGGDFYNFFVLGLYPAGFNPNATSTVPSTIDNTTSPASATSAAITGWLDPTYPAADVIEPGLLTSDGVITGYFLNSTLTGVLSIPSFETYESDTDSFSNTIAQFLRRSQQA